MTPLPEDFPNYAALVESPYGTVEEVLAASDEQLLAVKGIGATALRRIREALAAPVEPPAPAVVEPAPVEAAPVEPTPAPAEPVKAVRAKVQTGLLYHENRWHARGDTVALAPAQAERLRAQGAVSY